MLILTQNNNKVIGEVIILKKVVIFIILMISSIIGILSLNPIFVSGNIIKTHFDSPAKPPAGSKEELYQDIFITLLGPSIEKAIEDYYGKPYGYDPWSVDVLNIERPNGDRTTYFIIKLQVMPYIGAHNTIGIDNLTIEVSYGKKPKILKFKHIKSYEIPPWLR